MKPYFIRHINQNICTILKRTSPTKQNIAASALPGLHGQRVTRTQFEGEIHADADADADADAGDSADAGAAGASAGGREPSEIFMSIGNSETGTVLHQHSEAFNVVVVGSKRWFLYVKYRVPCVPCVR